MYLLFIRVDYLPFCPLPTLGFLLTDIILSRELSQDFLTQKLLSRWKSHDLLVLNKVRR